MVQQLKELRATKADAIRALITKATSEKRDLTDQEQAAFDALKGEIEKAEKDLRNAEFVAEVERRMEGGTPVGTGDNRFDALSREFSLRKAIASQIPGLVVDAAKEIEISQELARRNGPGQGLLCPMNIFEKRVVTTALPVGGPGANVIGTDWRPDQFIDLLYINTGVRRLGARTISNLVGNVDIPKLSKSAVGYWVAENVALTPSDVEFSKLQLSPKHCGALTEVSRNMLLQASPDVETILREHFAQLLGGALDRAAINGDPDNDEPQGILGTASIGDVPGGASGLALTYANVIACIAKVAGANALGGSLGFLTNSKVVAKAATTLKDAADTSSNFIIPDPGAGTLAGFPLVMSNNVPDNITKNAVPNLSALIFGNWADCLIGVWSSFDLLVNPFDSTAYPKGNALLRAMMTVDVGIRHVESFCAIQDIITT